MFYIFFWMLIVLGVCEIILPFTMNADCSVQGSNASIKAWMALNGREWSYFELAWSLLMLRNGMAISNLRFWVVVVLGEFALLFWDHKDMDQACFRVFLRWYYPYIAWPLLTLGFAYLERHVTGNEQTTAETGDGAECLVVNQESATADQVPPTEQSA